MGIPWMYPDPHVYPDKVPAGTNADIPHLGPSLGIAYAKTLYPYSTHAYPAHDTPSDKSGPLVPKGSAAFSGNHPHATHAFTSKASIKLGVVEDDFPSLGLATQSKPAFEKLKEATKNLAGPAGLLTAPITDFASTVAGAGNDQTTHTYPKSLNDNTHKIGDVNPNAINLATEIIPRNLPERSFLRFVFPEEAGKTTTAILPFFEDVQIKESKKANYAKYNPLARSSQLYAYTGAESRKIQLTFSITAPHILAEANRINIFNGGPTTSEIIKSFFPFSGELQTKTHGAVKLQSEYLSILAQFSKSPDFNTLKQLSYSQKKMLNYILELTNLVRASVINNARNSSLGPPIVRLNHGILYRDIPCLVTDYSLDYPVKNTGHDLRTLLPRRINVRLSLEEVRTGNFKEFIPSVAPERDNLAGWEAIFDASEGGTLDPQPLPVGT